MADDELQIVKNIADMLVARQQLLAVAESCTGGGLAKVCTDLPGSSAWFDRGFVTYSNLSKMELLGVKEQTLSMFGAVSEEVVAEMAAGVLINSPAHWSVAVSGVAGPDGGSVKTPVGTVWLAWMHAGESAITKKLHLAGDRSQVRSQTIVHALKTLTELMA